MHTTVAHWALRLAGSLAVSVALFHCGGATEGAPTKGSPTPSPSSEAGTSPEAGVTIEAGTVVGLCDDSGGCPSGSSCYYEIGSCSAKGQCVEDQQGGAICNSVEILCGCGDAGTVYAGCAFPGGYASGPTTGNGDCAQGAVPVPEAGTTEASTDCTYPTPDNDSRCPSSGPTSYSGQPCAVVGLSCTYPGQGDGDGNGCFGPANLVCGGPFGGGDGGADGGSPFWVLTE